MNMILEHPDITYALRTGLSHHLPYRFCLRCPYGWCHDSGDE